MQQQYLLTPAYSLLQTASKSATMSNTGIKKTPPKSQNLLYLFLQLHAADSHVDVSEFAVRNILRNTIKALQLPERRL